LKHRDITYADLVEALARIGIEDNEVNIRNKVARGMFTAVFLGAMFEGDGVCEIRPN